MQYDVFMECMQDQTLSEYNLSYEFIFPKHTDKLRIKKAVEDVIDARPIFRNRLILDEDGNPRQYSDPKMQIEIPMLQMSEEGMEEYIENVLTRPFRLLGNEPYCRFAIVETEDSIHLLHCMHHTITDGVTISTLYAKRDLPAAFEGKPLRKETQTIYEYTLEEEKLIGTEAYAEASRRYAERFAGVKPTVLLHGADSCKGHLIQSDIKMADNGMKKWCRLHHIQHNSLIQAAFTLVLSHWSREQKVAYISMRHGRNHRQQLTSYGLYANMMPVASDADPEMNVLDFIRQIADDWHSTLLMDNHSMYKFCEAVGCTPTIFYAYQGNMVIRSCTVGGTELPVRQIVHGMTDDDLQCMIYNIGNDYEIHMEASDANYDMAYIIRFAEAVRDCVYKMMKNPDRKLRELELD